MEVLNCQHFQLSFIQNCKSGLYLEALKFELEDSLNKCALVSSLNNSKVQMEFRYIKMNDLGLYNTVIKILPYTPH